MPPHPIRLTNKVPAPLRRRAAPWLRAAGLPPVLMLAAATDGSSAQAPGAAPRRPVAELADEEPAPKTGPPRSVGPWSARAPVAAVPLGARRWDAPRGPYHVPTTAIADRVRSSGASRGARRGAVIGAGVGAFIGLTAALAQTDDAAKVATATLLSSALLAGVGAAAGALIGGVAGS